MLLRLRSDQPNLMVVLATLSCLLLDTSSQQLDNSLKTTGTAKPPLSGDAL